MEVLSYPSYVLNRPNPLVGPTVKTLWWGVVSIRLRSAWCDLVFVFQTTALDGSRGSTRGRRRCKSSSELIEAIMERREGIHV